MRSQLFYLGLVAVYSSFAASASLPAVHAGHHLRHARGARPFGKQAKGSSNQAAQPTLALSRRAAAAPTAAASYKTVTTVTVVPLTRTTTKVVTRVTGTSTRTLTYTQTLTRTATTTADSTGALAASLSSSSSSSSFSPASSTASSAMSTTKSTSSSKTTSTSSSSSSSSSSAAPSKTTYSALVTPIPTSTKAVFDGVGTYYYTGLGACGWWSQDTDMIVAVQDKVFDNYPGATLDDPNNNPICGKKVKISYGGVTIQAMVVDRCAGCELYHMDMSPTAFSMLAPLDVGYLQTGLTWSWA